MVVPVPSRNHSNNCPAPFWKTKSVIPSLFASPVTLVAMRPPATLRRNLDCDVFPLVSVAFTAMSAKPPRLLFTERFSEDPASEAVTSAGLLTASEKLTTDVSPALLAETEVWTLMLRSALFSRVTWFPAMAVTFVPRKAAPTWKPAGGFETVTMLLVVELEVTSTTRVVGKSGTTEALVTRTALAFT